MKGEKGFTLAELLAVVAIIGVLVGIGIPVFANQTEKAREATDIANIRAAYAEVKMAAIQEDTLSDLYDSELDEYTKKINLCQRKDGWTLDAERLNIGGVARADVYHWKGDARKGGSCTVVYDVISNSTTLVWSGYTIKLDYQWFNINDCMTIKPVSWDPRSWPCNAIPDFINAQNGKTKVIVGKITDEYPNLKAYLDRGGGYEIGISTTDVNGKELDDTGGQYLFIDPNKEDEFAINTTKAAIGDNVKLAIQFFKMKSTTHGQGSVKMTEAEARELEQLITVTNTN